MSAELCPQGRTDHEACFAPFRYCPVKGCGRTERDRQPRIDFPATFEERLDRIAGAHSKQLDEHGGTTGDCNECGWIYVTCSTSREFSDE